MSKKEKAAKFEAEQGAMFVVNKDGSYSTKARLEPLFNTDAWTKDILSRPVSAKESEVKS